ncbi:MAG: ATP-dependent Clp protease ATP-binding subunit ClpX, partial [Sedimenticola sp.]
GSKGIGFHVDFSDPGKAYDQLRLFEEVQPDDLRHFGLIPEFIGRFPVITALHDLDEAALVKILTEPRNALVKQYQRLFEFEGVKLDFTPEALTSIAKQAIERGTGARGLRGVMEGLLRKVMYDMPSLEGAMGCVVDEDAAKGDKPVGITCGG